MSKPSQRYADAVTALAALVQAEGPDAATRAYAQATWETRREQWAAKHGGLKQSAGHVCLSRLLGKRRCNEAGPDTLRPCRPPGADHCSLWLKDGVPEVLVSQPYGLGLQTMRELVALCDRCDFDASVDTWPAWHFPGGVLMVEIRRAARG